MLFDARSAVLLVIDMQDRLLSVMGRPEETIDACLWTAHLAKKLDIPIIFSEQNRRGLGLTIPSLTAISPTAPRLEKMAFSCWAESEIAELIRSYAQVILVGIEAHICVLQTALELKRTASRAVFVVEPAVDSRRASDKAAALDRMRLAGIQILTPEMLLFEALRTANHPDFKELSKQFVSRSV